MKHTAQHKKRHISIYILLVLLSLVSILPFLTMIINSTRSDAQIVEKVSLIPGRSFYDNMISANSSVNVFKGFINSAYIAIVTTIASTYISALVAYGFHAYDFKGKKVLFLLVIFAMMFPVQLTIIGFYQTITAYNLLDNHLALILPALANATSVFFIRQYAQQVVNKALIESGRIDGANEFCIFNKIIFPILAPATITMGIFSFIASWNNYLSPMLIMKSRNKYTLPVMIRIVESAEQYTVNYGAVYFVITITVLPILLVFVIFSKKIIGGLVAGSIKG